MWGPALSLLLVAGAPCPSAEGTEALPTSIRAQVAVATARAAMRDGRALVADACLDLALDLEPDSTLALRSRAQLRLQTGDLDGASADAARAAELGDVDPELAELRAIVATGQGDRPGARKLARAAGSWEGDLIGVGLDDRGAAFTASGMLGEPTARGALVAAVLAAHEAREGNVPEAEALALQAVRDARLADAPDVGRVARGLASDLEARAALGWSARLRTTVDYLTNPAYASQNERSRASSVRVAALGDVDARFALGPVRVRTGLEVRQHGLLARRSRFCCLDIFAYRLTGGLELPIGPDPRAVRLGLVMRWTDVFADRFRFHHASHLEGGPTLAFSLGPRLGLDLAFLGVYTDFVNTSPPDAVTSSLNRDRVGQRAVLGLALHFDWLDARLEAMFLNDDADGDAFDALGGAVATWIEAKPAPDLVVFLGGGLTLREYGPVGDRAVIGDAATRTELRSAIRVGARLRLVSGLELVIEDVFIDTSARAGHDYTDNVLSVGVQTAW